MCLIKAWQWQQLHTLICCLTAGLSPLTFGRWVVSSFYIVSKVTGTSNPTSWGDNRYLSSGYGTPERTWTLRYHVTILPAPSCFLYTYSYIRVILFCLMETVRTVLTSNAGIPTMRHGNPHNDGLWRCFCIMRSTIENDRTNAVVLNWSSVLG